MAKAAKNTENNQKNLTRKLFRLVFLVLVILLLIAGSVFFLYSKVSAPTTEEKIASQLIFNDGFTDSEKQDIQDRIAEQSLSLDGDITAKAVTATSYDPNTSHLMSAYVPVTNFNAPTQSIDLENVSNSTVYLLDGTDPIIANAIAKVLAIDESSIRTTDSLDTIGVGDIAFIHYPLLTNSLKLVQFEGHYILDEFTAGAIFRTAEFSGEHAESLQTLTPIATPTKETTLSYTQTGVTALTRIMMRKLNEVGDPLFFSQKIGDFLAAADVTHVSNEVSFMEGCPQSYTAFCSDPRFIETLKASGVDIVELTGNHNNDLGSQNNTDTINLYHQLGWQTVGGGLNREEAAKYIVTDKEGSKVALLAYNYPDAPNGGAIAGITSAGANPFDFSFASIATDIENAKKEADFVIVDVQYWECYAYPDGYVEYPTCDVPTGEQEPNFKKLIDLGADMVVGTSAHQPQYYELYNGKPIYYGLGNLYFDQTQWPGTERGIILTHYFYGGKLLQTKLTPTRFDQTLQTDRMNETDAEDFLARLQSSRQ